jgi:DNA-binding transcriptional ArsR family regulator
MRRSLAKADSNSKQKALLTLFRCLAKYKFMNLIFKALSDPTRRKVLELLRQRPMTAGELSEHFTVSKPTMSAHFATLREAGLIEGGKTGTVITYRLNLSVLEDAILSFTQALGLGAEKPVRDEDVSKDMEKGKIL